MARPGSIAESWFRDPERAALVLDDLGHLGGELRGVARVVLGRVRDAEAAAEVHLGERDAELLADAGLEREHPSGRDLEAGAVEDLAPDVGVETEEVESVGGLDHLHGLPRVAVGDREPELLVLVRGRDVLVGVRLDAGSHADHHVLTSTLTRRSPRVARSRGTSPRRSAPRPRAPRGAARGTSCCCRGSRSGSGRPRPAARRSARRSEQTSRFSPSSWTQRATVVQRNALPA